MVRSHYEKEKNQSSKYINSNSKLSVLPVSPHLENVLGASAFIYSFLLKFYDVIILRLKIK